MSLSAK